MGTNLPPCLVCFSLFVKMDNSIKAIFINVNSIVSRHKRHYLNLFIIEHKPDVMLLAEHCLSSRHRFGIEGYTLFRRDRQSGRGGGTAVLIRQNFQCEEIVLDTGMIENTAARIRCSNGRDIVFVAMYLKPNNTFAIDSFDSIQNLAVNNNVVIGCDLNARHPYWGDPYTNVSGRNLRDFLLANPDLEVRQTDGPTRKNVVLSSFIDFFITTVDLGPSSGILLRTIDYESDHKAVEISLNAGNCMSREVPSRFDFDGLNIRRFRSKLSENLADCGLPLDRNVTESEIDECVTNLNCAFVDAMEYSIPKILVKGRGMLKLPLHIINFITHKKRLRRALHRCSEPGRASIMKAEIKNLDKIVQGAISVFEREHLSDYLSNVRLNNTTFRKVKSAVGLNVRPAVQSLKGPGGLIVSDDNGKANLLADSFFRVQQTGQLGAQGSTDDTVRRELETLDRTTPLMVFDNFSTADGRTVHTDRRLSDFGFIDAPSVGSALKRRANKRSSGFDGVPDFVLRKSDNVVWTFLAILFNHCINIGYFPQAWKAALVVPILKPRSDATEAGNYRPISLLSAFGKLFEFFILGMINEVIFDCEILKDFQFGFRNGHSTSHALLVFSDYVAEGLNRRCPTMVASLDFAKAFDTVWHDGLLYKMLNFGFGRNICRLAASFLSGRTFKVRVGTIFSDIRLVQAGVPQGSLLGPVLYNLYVSDLPQPTDGNLLLTYADDILVASKGANARRINNGLNTYLTRLNDYFGKWRLNLNMSKTVAVFIKGKRKYIYPNCRKYVPCLKIGGELVNISDRVRYLGVTFHENFEFYRHIDNVLERSKKVYNLYQSILRRKGGLGRKVRLLVYRQIIRPLISYAFTAWFGISSAQMERLRRWERRILVACLGLRPRLGPDGVLRRPSCKLTYSQVDFGRIDNFMVEKTIKFLESAQNLENDLVKNCFSNSRSLERIGLAKYLSPVDLLTLREAGLLHEGANLLFYHRRIHTMDINNTVYNTAQ